MDAARFSVLMNRFYDVATDVLSRSHAFIDKFVGDEVVGIYLPVFAGADHSRAAIDAARELLRATGHGDPDGPWIPIGIGVHTGPAYFGTVQGAQGALADLTALGDSVKVASRLASNAAAGEALVSDAAATAAGSPIRDLPRRDLQLKGRSERVSVRVLKVS